MGYLSWDVVVIYVLQWLPRLRSRFTLLYALAAIKTYVLLYKYLAKQNCLVAPSQRRSYNDHFPISIYCTADILKADNPKMLHTYKGPLVTEQSLTSLEVT